MHVYSLDWHMETIKDLFEHDLEDVYYAEHELLDALQDLAEETDDEEIEQAFREHREETETHIERLEEVFKMIDKSPEKEECEGIQGLVKEHEDFVSHSPDQAVLNVHNLAAAEKTEHYEIAAYGNLAFLADRLDMDEAADLLGETLDEEKETLEKLKELTESYDYNQIND